MTNDLVKRLRRADEYEPLGHDGWEAADRIEQLEKEKREAALDAIAALGQAQDAYEAQLGAEAKLAKAVEALEKVQAFVRDLAPYADQGHALVPALFEACETLEELKGEARNG